MYTLRFIFDTCTADSDSEPEDALHIGSNNDDGGLGEPPQKKKKVEDVGGGLYNDFSARMMVSSQDVVG